ncbi:alkaline phosphatase family protein [Streptomyces sp. NBC_01210]|uniref:alkaline phosphatase family protein n=1 Tax=Streptomyces sp. NBC_01210 TaxID=2903774 RepID=UPI002E1161A1|nr:alkaline phosphatase family protein [Streptomyces sp. NBC_01210]
MRISRRRLSMASITTVAVLATVVVPFGFTAAAYDDSAKVLVVGVDGLRYDRIWGTDAIDSGEGPEAWLDDTVVDTPNLDGLRSGGTYGRSLLYCDPLAATSSGPGWKTNLSGVWPDKFAEDNSEGDDEWDAYPSFLNRLEGELDDDIDTYAAYSWVDHGPEGDDVFSDVDETDFQDYDPDEPSSPPAGKEEADVLSADENSVESAVEQLSDEDPDASFVYFDEPDFQGHHGSPETYRDAIERVDGYIGELLDAIDDREDAESWTVIVTTDHGQEDDGGHGGCTIGERSQFVLARGPGIAEGAEPIDVRPVDVVPTVFQQLGVEIDEDWGLEGKAIQDRSADAFDSAYSSLAERVDDTDVPENVKGFTHTMPGGWTVDNSQMPNNGSTEWRGWALTTNAFWSISANPDGDDDNDADDRQNFMRSRGVIAVADPDQWDDEGSPSDTTTFNSTLISPAYSVAGKDSVTLTFGNHYKDTSPQVGELLVSIDGGNDQVIKTYDDDALNQIESIPIDVEDASTLQVKFRLKDAENDWYWAIDDVQVN